VEQLALAQQIELLQQQQQQIAATHQQYVNLGMIQPQQQLPQQTYNQVQGHLSPPQTYGFAPQQQFAQQPMGMGMSPQAGAHRRNQSAVPNMSMPPPPVPQQAANAGGFSDFSFPNQSQKSENVNPRARGGSTSTGSGGGGGHNRRHSLALPEAKKAAELAESKRKSSAFQFPIPGAGGASPSSTNRSVSPATNDAQTPQQGLRTGVNAARAGHGRSQSMAVGNNGKPVTRGGPAFQFPPPASESSNSSELGRRGSQGHGRNQSRNFDQNWRQPQQPTINEPQGAMGNFQMNQHAGAQPFQPGHRNRNSMSHASMSSLSGFQFPGSPQLVQLPQGGQVLVQPNMFQGQQLNPLQLAQIQAYQAAGLQPPITALQGGQGGQQLSMQQQQQQRKTLFTPYLPQATLPALLPTVSLSRAFSVSTRRIEATPTLLPTTSMPTSSFVAARIVTELSRATTLLLSFSMLTRSGLRSARRRRRRNARTLATLAQAALLLLTMRPPSQNRPLPKVVFAGVEA